MPFNELIPNFLLQQQYMRFQERDPSSKRKYSKISINKRNKLIESVINRGQTLLKTIKKLNINLSTARLIIKKYKETGAFCMKNFRHPPKESPYRSYKQQSTKVVSPQKQLTISLQNDDIMNNEIGEPQVKQQIIGQGQCNLNQIQYLYYPYMLWM